MSKGALLELSSHGVQDIYIIGNPNYSHFKKVYKRHTNFSMESIRGTFNGNGNFGEKITLEIPRSGDLLSSIIMEVDLPLLEASGSDTVNEIQYVSNIGQSLIEYAEFKIGGQTIDKQYTEWMFIWNQLTLSSSKIMEYNQMIKSTSQNGPITVYVPFQFWFCRDIANAIPLVALQYHDLELEIKFRPLSKLYNFGDKQYYDLQYIGEEIINNTTLYTYGIVKGAIFSSYIGGKKYVYNNGNQEATITYKESDKILLDVRLPDSGLTRGYVKPIYTLIGEPKISDIRLYLDYIYLDTFERSYFAREEHRYLIEQVQFSENIGVISSEQTKKIVLDFYLPVKELFWVCQNDEILQHNEILKFNNSPDTLYENNKDDIINVSLLYNGSERFEVRNGEYFRLIQPYQKHTNYVFDKYIYVYSFATKPELHQPSGIANFSKIDKIEFIFNLRRKRSYNSTIKVFAINYNILRIAKGMGGIAFSN